MFEETAAWYPYNLTKTDDKNLVLDKFLIDSSCQICSGPIVDFDHVHGNQPCGLIADKSIRQTEKGYEKLFTVAHLKDGKMSTLIDRVCQYRNWKRSDLIAKVGADYGQQSLKFCLQFYTKEFIQKAVDKKLPVNTTDTTFIIGITGAKESHETNVDMYRKCQIDTLFNSGIHDTVLVFDLSFVNKLLGLSSGNCKFPCIFCQYVGVVSSRENIDQSMVFPYRSILDWKSCLDKVNSNTSVIGKRNLSVEKSPASWLLIENLVRNWCIAPPPLHIMLGLVNSVFDSVEKLNVDNSILDWTKESGARKRGQDSKFNGPNCQKLINRAETLLRHQNPELQKYYWLLKNFKKANQSYNKVGFVNQRLIRFHRQQIDSVIRQWFSIDSLTSRPHKVHYMRHVPVWEMKKGYLIGTFSETNFESIHSKFLCTAENYKGKVNGLRKAIESWNSLRFTIFSLNKN